MLYIFLNYTLLWLLILFVIIWFFNIFINIGINLTNFKFNFILIILTIFYINFFILYNLYWIYSMNFIYSKLLIINSDYVLYFPFIFIFILITSISVIYCLMYNISELNLFIIYVTIILYAGFNLLLTNSLLLFFIYYEFLLIPSFFILYIFSKTRRSVEASYLMFFWTQFGALWLIFVLLYIYKLTGSLYFTTLKDTQFSTFDINFIFYSILVGFGVKFPIWPFYEWLPKAHVEASTNFSIFLSGVLVKFAFFGFLKVLYVLELEIKTIIIFPYLLVGLSDALFKMFYQVDIKKLIAYSTVVEMHWLLICVISGNNILLISACCMYISHAILSTNSFLLVDSVARRFKTRLILEISGLNYMCPKLFLMCLINLIIFLGFPGSLFFISEVLFFTYLLDLLPLFCLIIFFLVYFILANIFIKIWLNFLFGSITTNVKILTVDLDKTELLIFSFMNILIFWLGSSWLSFFF